MKTALDRESILGLSAKLGEGSTDSNVPMNLGIPAITIGGGGREAARTRWTRRFDANDSFKGTQRALLLAVALVR